MTMHPIEHLYYFSNAFTPSLYLGSLSPLVFTWNFVHLTIAPACGHSGFEDHFQSDQYHWVHHSKFECNYGSPMSAPLDQALGTFREKISKSKAYAGEWSEKHDDNREALAAAKKPAWSPNGYLGLAATWDHFVYSLFTLALFPLCYCAATSPAEVQHFFGNATAALPESLDFATAVAATVAYAPVPVAMALCKLSGDSMSWRWPFQREQVAGVFGAFFVAAFLLCMYPMFLATKLVISAA